MDLLYRKEGLPEESELLICEVTKIYYNSVFVHIIEYNVQGMIHISEISPGRIRNIHDYVKIGKMIICKVLRVNREKGHVDLSLRRVSESQRREKSDEIKREQTSEKIIEFVANKLKIPKRELYDKIVNMVFNNYGMLHNCFESVVKNNKLLFELGIEKKIAEELTKTILERIKPPKYRFVEIIKLSTYETNGVGLIKDCLLGFLENHPNLDLRYLGSGNYRIETTKEDVKSAENNIIDFNKHIENYISNIKKDILFEIVQKNSEKI